MNDAYRGTPFEDLDKKVNERLDSFGDRIDQLELFRERRHCCSGDVALDRLDRQGVEEWDAGKMIFKTVMAIVITLILSFTGMVVWTMQSHRELNDRIEELERDVTSMRGRDSISQHR
jgi:hypothetical protein